MDPQRHYGYRMHGMFGEPDTHPGVPGGMQLSITQSKRISTGGQGKTFHRKGRASKERTTERKHQFYTPGKSKVP